MNDFNNKKKENSKNKNLNEENSNFNDELNDINYDDIDYDLNQVNNSKKNNNENPKISKLKATTSPYERLELLNQLEMDNKKETEELLANMENNQDLSQNLDDI